MKTAWKLFRRFGADERGLETVEYAIITGIIVIGTLTVIASIGGWVMNRFNVLDSGLQAGP